MIIRRYKNEDCESLAKLFYDTVHNVNSKDYTYNQLYAWAQSPDSLKERNSGLLTQKTLIAEIDSLIVGFCSIDNSGYLDLLFVHKDYLRQGIATHLCDEAEKEFTFIKTYASITAKHFFENRGYTVIKEQEVNRLGVKLKRFEMIKIKK